MLVFSSRVETLFAYRTEFIRRRQGMYDAAVVHTRADMYTAVPQWSIFGRGSYAPTARTQCAVGALTLGDQRAIR